MRRLYVGVAEAGHDGEGGEHYALEGLWKAKWGRSSLPETTRKPEARTHRGFEWRFSLHGLHLSFAVITTVGSPNAARRLVGCG